MAETIDRAKALELYELEQVCLGCTGCKGSAGIQALTDPVFNLCHGTGRVPLLDPEKVRIPCRKRAYPKRVSPNAQCPKCFGSGWTLSTDPWVYVIAAWQLTSLPVQVCADIMAAIKMGFDHGENPGLAVFDVVYEALVGKEKP